MGIKFNAESKYPTMSCQCIIVLLLISNLLLSLFHTDKSDGGDMESGVQEEDFFIQDEIYKSRLASIKRVLFVTC